MLGVLRRERDGDFERRQRGARLTLIEKRQASIDMRDGVARVQRDGPVEPSQRLDGLAALALPLAATQKKQRRVSRLGLDRFEQGLGVMETPRGDMVAHEPQIGVDVARGPRGRAPFVAGLGHSVVVSAGRVLGEVLNNRRRLTRGWPVAR